jgi:2-dehydro-3-deoxyglucarate aldolase
MSKNIKKQLKNQVVSLGSWITLGHSAIAEIMAKAGFDWLAVDLEHSVITIKETEELIRVINLSGVTPLVRLTSNDANQIKRVMDAGAHGVIVPQVNSAKEARDAVSAVYYPPRGTRGVGLARSQGYGAQFSEYKDWLDANAVVITQIEHIKAVENIEEILTVDGVDGYIIGPYDLSASMGIPGQLEHPDVVKAIAEINRAATKLNKPGGVHVIEPDPGQLKQRISEGFNFIAYSLDIRMLDVSCREAFTVDIQQERLKEYS